MFPIFNKEKLQKKNKPTQNIKKTETVDLPDSAHKLHMPHLFIKKNSLSAPLETTTTAYNYLEPKLHFASNSTLDNFTHEPSHKLVFSLHRSSHDSLQPNLNINLFASNPSNSSQSNAQDQKAEQVIQNFYFKACQVIILSRVSNEECFNCALDITSASCTHGFNIENSSLSLSNQSSFFVKLNKWFNLITVDSKKISDSADFWNISLHSFNSYARPLFINIYIDLSKLPSSNSLHLTNSNRETICDISSLLHSKLSSSSRQIKNRLILETWQIHMNFYDSNNIPELPNVYKKSIVLFRSLYGLLPLLPTTEVIKRFHSENFADSVINWSITQQPTDPETDIDLSLFLPSSILPIRTKKFQTIATPIGNIELETRYIGVPNFYTTSSLKSFQKNLNVEMIEIDDSFFTPTITTLMNKNIEPRSMPTNFDPYFLRNNNIQPSPLRINSSFDLSQETDNLSQEKTNISFKNSNLVNIGSLPNNPVNAESLPNDLVNTESLSKDLVNAEILPKDLVDTKSLTKALVNNQAYLPLPNKNSLIHSHTSSYDNPISFLNPKCKNSIDENNQKLVQTTFTKPLTSINSINEKSEFTERIFELNKNNRFSLGSNSSLDNNFGIDKPFSAYQTNSKLLYNKIPAITSNRSVSNSGKLSLQLVSPFKSGKNSYYSANSSLSNSNSEKLSLNNSHQHQDSSLNLANLYSLDKSSSQNSFLPHGRLNTKLKLEQDDEYSTSYDHYMQGKKPEYLGNIAKARTKSMWIPTGNRPSIFKSLNGHSSENQSLENQFSTSNSSTRTIESKLVSSFQKRRSKRWSNLGNASQTSISIPHKQELSNESISNIDNHSFSNNSSSFRNNPIMTSQSRQNSINISHRYIEHAISLSKQDDRDTSLSENSAPNDDISDFLKTLDTKFQTPGFNKDKPSSLTSGRNSAFNIYSQASNLSILLKDDLNMETNSNSSACKNNIDSLAIINKKQVNPTMPNKLDNQLDFESQTKHPFLHSENNKSPKLQKNKEFSNKTSGEEQTSVYKSTFTSKDIFKNKGDLNSIKNNYIQRQTNSKQTITCPTSVTKGCSPFYNSLHRDTGDTTKRIFNQRPSSNSGSNIKTSTESLSLDDTDQNRNRFSTPIMIPQSLPFFKSIYLQDDLNNHGNSGAKNKVDFRLATNKYSNSSNNSRFDNSNNSLTLKTNKDFSPNSRNYTGNRYNIVDINNYKEDIEYNPSITTQDNNKSLYKALNNTYSNDLTRLPENTPRSYKYYNPNDKTLNRKILENRQCYSELKQNIFENKFLENEKSEEKEYSEMNSKPTSLKIAKGSTSLNHNKYNISNYTNTNMNKDRYIIQHDKESESDHSIAELEIYSDDDYEHLVGFEVNKESIGQRNNVYDNSLIFNLSQTSLPKPKQPKK
ncbi:hypothetical protein BB561_003682 [Smittium simulii]|uniref:Autophagy-related protein 13 n=1 Tax=Smittium simulii TaxID=133385 RepID=A0A2T9YK11_9FUNG|nr:hypothetical protein BB561_003682 [Smittium simulii]